MSTGKCCHDSSPTSSEPTATHTRGVSPAGTHLPAALRVRDASIETRAKHAFNIKIYMYDVLMCNAFRCVMLSDV